MIATIAAISNLPYESVAQLSPRKPGQIGLYPREVRKLLQQATQIKWRFPKTVFFRRLRSFCDSKNTQIVLIRQPGFALLQRITRKSQHCIFVRAGQIFDPEYNGSVRTEDYERINWIPTIAFYPVDWNKLREIQDGNSVRYRKDRLWSEIIGG